MSKINLTFGQIHNPTKEQRESSWFDFNEMVEFATDGGVDCILEGENMYKAKVQRFEDQRKLQIKHARERQKAKEQEAEDKADAIEKDAEEGQGFSEEVEDIQEISLKARRKMSKTAKRTAKRRARSRARKAKRKKTGAEIKVKSNREARNMIRKKILKQMKWSDVSIQQKERIETLLNKKKAKITKLAKKLYPAMQKKEQARLASVRRKMTSNNPKVATEGLDMNFEIMIDEGMKASTNRLANRAFSAATKSGTHGVSNRDEEHHVQHEHDNNWEDSSNPWDHVIVVKDLVRDTYKLEVAHAFKPDRHELVRGPSVRKEIPSKSMVKKSWAVGFSNKAIAANERNPHATGWEETPTSKDLMAHDDSEQQSQPEQPEQPTQEVPQDVEQQPELQVDAEGNVVPEERTFEQHASKEQKKNGRSCKECTYDSWDHKPEDLEAGIVVAQNLAAGMSEEEAYSTLSDKANKRLKLSATALDSAKRIQENLISELIDKYGGEVEDWVGDHSGTGVATPNGKKVPANKLLTNEWKNPTIGDKTMEGQGGTNATPKADLILRNQKTGQVIPISLKTGDAQLMSGKAGESRATLAFALNETKGNLHKNTIKKVEGLLGEMDKWVTKAATPMGDPSQFSPRLFMPGSKKTSWNSKEEAMAVAGDDRSKAKEIGETWDQITEMVQVHKKFNEKLNEILSSSPALKHAIIKESMTGWGKYGKDSELAASFVLSSNADGTGSKIVKITDEYVDAVANSEGINFGVRNKSNQRELKSKKSGSYSFYSAWSINIKQKSLDYFKSNLNAGFISFTEYQRYITEHEELFKETEEGDVLEFLKNNPPPDISTSEYMKKAKEWIGNDLGRLMEFMSVDVESVEVSHDNLSDVVQKGKKSNTITVDGKKFDIPVDDDIKGKKENDNDTLDSYIQDIESNGMDESFKLFAEEEATDTRKAYLKKYAATPKQRKRRSSRTNARQKCNRSGRCSVGDGKDLDHKNGNPMDNSSNNLRLISRSTNRGRDNNKWRTDEEHGAGEVGTDELLQTYLKDTPFMKIENFKKKSNRK